MQIAGLHAHVAAVVRQILGHTLRQGRDEHPLAMLDTLFALSEEVVYLALDRTHGNLRIHQPRGPDDLLGHKPLGGVELEAPRRGRHVDGLIHQIPELVKMQGSVIQSRRKAEAVVHERLFAGMVALVHPPYLGHRDVRLIDKEQKIGRKIVEEAGRRLARLPAIQMAGVILNASAVAELLDHLEVELCALLKTFSLQELALALEFPEASAKFLTDILAGAQQVIPG